jgi:hypothetical protein
VFKLRGYFHTRFAPLSERAGQATGCAKTCNIQKLDYSEHITWEGAASLEDPTSNAPLLSI